MLFGWADEARLSPDAVRSEMTCEELYELYATDVLRFAYFYLGDRHRAEDVCQDVFVRFLTNQPQIEAGHEKAWLLRVAVNRCRDIWRSSWLKRVVLGHPAFELFPAPDEIENLAEKQELMEAVNSLPTVFREVILLHFYQGFNTNEIAEMLSIAVGTVASRTNRGKKLIEQYLNGGLKNDQT